MDDFHFNAILTPFRFDRNRNDEGVLLYFLDDLVSNSLPPRVPLPRVCKNHKTLIDNIF